MCGRETGGLGEGSMELFVRILLAQGSLSAHTISLLGAPLSLPWSDLWSWMLARREGFVRTCLEACIEVGKAGAELKKLLAKAWRQEQRIRVQNRVQTAGKETGKTEASVVLDLIPATYLRSLSTHYVPCTGSSCWFYILFVPQVILSIAVVAFYRQGN